MAAEASTSSVPINNEASERSLDAQQVAQMMEDEDPLLISQSLTYVTDDGGILHSFQSAPFSTGTLCVVCAIIWGRDFCFLLQN
jgi:hypothetical protein